MTAADFTHPFGSPLTETPCVEFQVLGDLYNTCLNIDLPQFSEDGEPLNYSKPNKDNLKELYKELFTTKISGHYWQTFITNSMVRAHIDADKAKQAQTNATSPTYNTEPFPTKPSKEKFNNWKKKFTDTRDSLFLFATYHPDKIKDIIKK